MFSFADVWAKAKRDYIFGDNSTISVAAAQWIDCATALRLEGDTAYFSCPSSFQCDMFLRYKEQVLSGLERALGFRVDITVTSPEEAPVKLYKENSVSPAPFTVSLLDTYTFSNFVVGEGNRVAHAISDAVSKEPGTAYNPLFIYGDSGLGKTHLMCAIGNRIRKHNPNANIVYVKGEEFTNELIEAIGKEKTIEFRNKYRQADVFLVDDVQFIGGKRSTEEEMFHTFNSLYNARKQIVLTSDRPPKEIPTLEDRLRTRFENGPIIEVTKPDYETRCAIIKQKAAENNIELPQEIIDCLSKALKDNVRQLEGAVKKIKAGHTLMGKPLNLQLASDVLHDISSSMEPIEKRVERIIARSAEIHHVKPEDITSPKRTNEISKARNAAIYAVNELTNLSLPTIGSFFNRNHSTVINSLKSVRADMENDSNYKLKISSFIKDCQQ